MTVAVSPSVPDGRKLFVLGCSQTKHKTKSELPAISLYDGPMFRVLRTFLREHAWPEKLSVAVLSAKYGLIGGLSGITRYDERMTREAARTLRPKVTEGLGRLLDEHHGADLFMGRDYREAIDLEELGERAGRVNFIEGGIGQKLHALRAALHTFGAPHLQENRVAPLARLKRPLYFLPDWDDFLDLDYDFEEDRFSSPNRKDRNEAHSIELMRPDRLCDGVLVSLAQNSGTKGLLRRISTATSDSLAPRSVREHFRLESDQWAFGDCGAFSYSSEEEPSISVEQAVAVYDLYGFDLGASVDHIPLKKIRRNGKAEPLSHKERQKRVELTRTNADEFLKRARRQKARFTPVGIIQGLDADDFARQVPDYRAMGYGHLALGGLVPRSDREILDIVERVAQKLNEQPERPWLHLMGVFRPKLQEHFRRLGIDSFDSATYFRKAWLRSDQNYLGLDGKWYAAIRVPPSYDVKTYKRLSESCADSRQIPRFEQKALCALREFAQERISVETCLEAVMAYDRLLDRNDRDERRLREAYKRTLTCAPWQSCSCQVCRSLGIEVVVFRGLNRNKRRGAHNTLCLARKIREESCELKDG